MKTVIRELGTHYPLLHIEVDFLGKLTNYVIPLETAINMDLCINCIQEELIDDEPSIKDSVSYDIDHGKLREYILADILSEFEFTKKQLNNIYEIQRQSQS